MSIDGVKQGITSVDFYYDAMPNPSPVDQKNYTRHNLALSSGSTFADAYGFSLLINGRTSNLDAGTYSFTGKEEEPVAFEFWDGYAYERTKETRFTAGKIVISNAGDKYIIDVDGKADGKVVVAAHQLKTNLPSRPDRRLLTRAGRFF